MKKLGFDLILLGDPAAGKDTQAALLMKQYNLKPVESGKYWRALAKKNTPEGRLLRKTMGLGHPTPVVLMKKFLIDNLKKRKNNQDLIFIGNPRLKPEAQLLVKMFKSQKRDFFALDIKLPEKEVYKRSLGRVRIATEDRKQYIKNRINWHKHQMGKTVKYFVALRRMKIINGNQTIKQVHSDILKALHDR